MPPDDQPSLFAPETAVKPEGKVRAFPDEPEAHEPLAARMRPRTLQEIRGQERILGGDSLLPRLIRKDAFGSLLFYGPPGTGKTTLAEVIATETGSRLVRINAVLSNVAELRQVLGMARSRPDLRTLLFIDEIHRFNKAQQDSLLPDIESGAVRLIGATTHNPGFYLIPALLSRSHLFRLEPLGVEAIEDVLAVALTDEERGLGARKLCAGEGVLTSIARISEGDMRRALGAIETLAAATEDGGSIAPEDVAAFARERQIRYDSGSDEHYDTASAFIKSMRGGDPDAALYWMSKMLEGGEDPRFIARRMVILASEDVGLADSRALPLAVAAFHACEQIGLPECTLNLAHVVTYLATAPKSNSTTEALGAARRAIREGPVQPVPLDLRDAHTRLNKELGHGKGYRYSHNFPEAISGQEYLVEPQTFYTPGENGEEAAIAERLERWKKLKAGLQGRSDA